MCYRLDAHRLYRTHGITGSTTGAQGYIDVGNGNTTPLGRHANSAGLAGILTTAAFHTFESNTGFGIDGCLERPGELAFDLAQGAGFANLYALFTKQTLAITEIDDRESAPT
jgi:hypothetical protein